jgi:hypothetical protein
VTHHPRLAWDGAMMFVGAAHFDDLYGWLAPMLGDLLGADALRALAETRYQLTYSTRTDAQPVEAGRWRVRLEGLLDHDPALADPLAELIYETRIRLRELVPPLGVAG